MSSHKDPKLETKEVATHTESVEFARNDNMFCDWKMMFKMLEIEELTESIKYLPAMNKYQLNELERLKNELNKIKSEKTEKVMKYNNLVQSAQIEQDKVRNEIPSSQGRKT